MNRTGWMSLAFAGFLIAGGQAWSAAQEASKSDRPSQSDDPKAKADQPADGKLKPSESQPKKKLRRADDDDDTDDGNAPSTQGRRFTNPQDLFSEMERMMQ